MKNRPLFCAVLALLIVVGASTELAAGNPIHPKTEQLLEQALGGESIAAYWLPDSTTPARATEAMGVLYQESEGAAGNVTIEMGHFSRSGADYRLTGHVCDVYGVEPRDVTFL